MNALTDSAPITRVRVRLTAQDGGTRMEIRSAFASRAQMEELLRMGVVEGLQASVGQIDALLTTFEPRRA